MRYLRKHLLKHGPAAISHVHAIRVRKLLLLEEEHVRAVTGCGTAAKYVRSLTGLELINFCVLEQK